MSLGDDADRCNVLKDRKIEYEIKNLIRNYMVAVFESTLIFAFLLRDIDECTRASDKCAPNAFCNNTYGSYTCTCNPGYQRNGEECEGEFRRVKVPSAGYG